MRLKTPRIAPLTDSEMGPEVKEMIANRFGDAPVFNVFRTLDVTARHLALRERLPPNGATRGQTPLARRAQRHLPRQRPHPLVAVAEPPCFAVPAEPTLEREGWISLVCSRTDAPVQWRRD